MRIIVTSLIAAATLASAAPACAQEMIVTASRRSVNDYNNSGYVNGVIAAQRSIINLKRTADYVVQPVRLTGDTRDAMVRMADINTTLQNMIGSAGKAGVELATGDYLVEALTLTNYRRLTYVGDGRPDTSTTTFLVKVKLAQGMDITAAKAQIERFVGSVAKVGRSSLMTVGEPTLSVVNPDQYRGQIAGLIAADAAVMKAKFGTDYGVTVSGLDRPVEWARAGPTEVFLFLPSTYTVTRR